MKKLMLIVSACLILLALMAILFFSCKILEKEPSSGMTPKFRPVKLYYENSTGEVGITTYFYDISGKNYLAQWQLEDSSRSSVNHYEFDSLGNQTRKYREFSDGITSDQHFSYDAEGLLTRQDFSRSDGMTGETTYEYNDQNVCITASCKGFNGWFHGDLKYY